MTEPVVTAAMITAGVDAYATETDEECCSEGIHAAIIAAAKASNAKWPTEADINRVWPPDVLDRVEEWINAKNGGDGDVIDIARALLAASDSSPAFKAAPNPWRPIAEAKKNPGEFVDVWAVYRVIVNGEVHTERAGRYASARWVDRSPGKERWIDAGGNDIEYRETDTEGGNTVVYERVVTHFQPLPAPPAPR